MKRPNYLDIQVLKVFILLGIMGLNSSIIYGQDSLEDADIALTFSEENEVKTITAKATDSTGLPIEELDIYFYVKRTFSLLPIGDVFNTTDESGEVVVEFPNDLPADSEGYVTIIVKILESDIYNDLSVETVKKWGVQTSYDQFEEKRSLWAAAANAPITLVVMVSGMILAIWFIIVYIIVVLFKIRRIKPLTN